MVSRDLDEWGLNEDQVKSVIELADSKEVKADAVLFSLFTVGLNSRPKTMWNPKTVQDAMKGTGVRAVALEVGNFERGVVHPDLQMQVYAQMGRPFESFKIAFGRASSPKAVKQSLLEEKAFRQRTVDGMYIGYCGEISILDLKRTKPKQSQVVDAHGFLSKLDERQIKIAASLWHTRPRRYESQRKLLAASQGRVVLWTWSEWKLKGISSRGPFRAFFNGEDRSDRIVEVPQKIRPDLRVGLVDTAKLVQ